MSRKRRSFDFRTPIARIDNAINAPTRKYLSIFGCNFCYETGFHYLSQAIAGLVFAMAGYSGTPLVQKLGIKSGATVVLIGAPANYRKLLGKIPAAVKFSNKASDGMEFGHIFTKSRSDLETTLKELRGKIADSGTLWVSWPKKSSGVATDITEDVIRAVALPRGFVDVKVCAVDETWSGLKLMIRRRPAKIDKRNEDTTLGPH